MSGVQSWILSYFNRDGSESGDSLDGAPLDKGGRVSPAPAPPAGAFIKSKWETVDPEQVSSFDGSSAFFFHYL